MSIKAVISGVKFKKKSD